MRYFIAVIEDPKSEFESPDELEAELLAVWKDYGLRGGVAAVRRGGIIALRLMDQTPPVRHKDQGVYR